MISIQIVQIMAILYFLYALRMKVWETSVNTFIVFVTFFIITISREVDACQEIWTDWHLSIVAITMTVLMARVVWQSVSKKYKENVCSGCDNFKRRKDDL